MKGDMIATVQEQAGILTWNEKKYGK